MYELGSRVCLVGGEVEIAPDRRRQHVATGGDPGDVYEVADIIALPPLNRGGEVVQLGDDVEPAGLEDLHVTAVIGVPVFTVELEEQHVASFPQTVHQERLQAERVERCLEGCLVFRIFAQEVQVLDELIRVGRIEVEQVLKVLAQLGQRVDAFVAERAECNETLRDLGGVDDEHEIMILQ